MSNEQARTKPEDEDDQTARSVAPLQPTSDPPAQPDLPAAAPQPEPLLLPTGGVGAAAMVPPVNVTTTVNVQQSTAVLVQTLNRQPGCLTTLVYFIFVGSWLSAIWIGIAWLCNASVILLPVGLAMINRVPKIATLREPSTEFQVSTDGLLTRIQEVRAQQQPFWLRAIYFVVVGWWASFLWMYTAWFLSATLIGIPGAIWMYNRVPAVTTLRRY